MGTAQQAVHHITGVPARGRHWRPVLREAGTIGALTWVVAGLMAATAVNGLLTGRGAGQQDPRALSLFAQDVVVLGFVLPALLISMRLARRGSTRGALGWMASLFYAAYAHGLVVATQAVTPVHLLHVIVAGGAAYGAVSLAASLDLDRLAACVERSAHDRVIGAFFVVTAAFFAGLWASLATWHPAVGDVASSHPLITSVDGIVLLPLLVVGGRWLTRREPLGYALAAPLLVKTTGTFLTLVACSTLTWCTGLPAHAPLTGAFTVGLLTSAALTVVCFRQIRDP